MVTAREAERLDQGGAVYGCRWTVCPNPSTWADTPTHVAVGPHQKRGVTDIVRTAVFIRAMCAANIAGGGDPGRVRTAKGRT